MKILGGKIISRAPVDFDGLMKAPMVTNKKQAIPNNVISSTAKNLSGMLKTWILN